MTLGERLRSLHAALASAELPHAFGGAIALAYATEEPRGTRDLDVNVFVPTGETARVLAALPEAVTASAEQEQTLRETGQVRVFWDDTPVDLFLDYAPIHERAAKHRRMVPFEGIDIPVLGPIELAVFKAMFDRTKDWADIEAMLAAGALDVGAARAEIVTLVGEDDPRVARLDAAAS